MGFLEDRDLNDVPSIPEYYKGKTIFITGGSGFMGQVLIDKLLYSCTDLDRIYLLLRNKKGVKPEDRLDALYASSGFDRLRQEMPTVFKSKVFVVAGDVTDIGLGLSEEDRTLLVNKVNIIFHVAASVKFDDTLHYAAKLNLRGTREIVELAKTVRNLSAMVHVSTCYTNTKYDVIEERIYPPLADWRDTLEVCDVIDDHTLRILAPKYMDGMPNTYVFTKQLAEHVVYEQKGKLPVVIIRPSIVVSAEKEPLPGWTNNFNGPTGFLVAGGKGILRCLLSDSEHRCDYIPVDASIKNFIAVAWIRGTKNLETTDDVEIYNGSTNKLIDFRMRDLTDYGEESVDDIPLDNMLWPPHVHMTQSSTQYYVRVMLQQLLPAVLIDFLLWLLGKKPLLVKIQRRIYIASIALQYYTTKQWSFDNQNFLMLRSQIKREDRKQFYYDIEGIDYHSFLRASFLGGKTFLLKESLDDLPKARAHGRRIKILQQLVHTAFYAYAFWWTWHTRFVQWILSFL